MNTKLSPTDLIIDVLKNSLEKMENGFLDTLPPLMKIAVKQTTQSLYDAINGDEFKEAQKTYEEILILNAKIEALTEVFNFTELDSEVNKKAYKMMEEIIDKKNKNL